VLDQQLDAVRLGQIEVPLLVTAMGGGTAIRDNEWLYDQAASRDKDFFVLDEELLQLLARLDQSAISLSGGTRSSQ
jgi:hypothetical protein